MSQPLTDDPDLALVRACQAQESVCLEGAFRDLYEAYKDRVYNTCYRITGSATDAMDAAQETFATAFRRIDGFRFESRFSSWIYRVAVNASIDLRRRSASRPWVSLDRLRSPLNEGTPMDPQDEQVESPGGAASRRELEGDIQEAITRLSPKMKAITVLRYMEGLSYEEISESLDISLGTVKSRLSRAHGALDRELTPVLDRHLLN
jgi:RNA polymerase sigma-70 factor (ECF subfamily)